MIGENSEKALKAGAWYVVSSVIVKAIATLSTPIFTRLMTTEEFGMASTFVSWYTLLLPFCTLNLTYSIGRAKLDYPKTLDKYVGSMQLLSMVVTGIWVGFTIVFIKPLSSFFELSVPLVVFLCIYLLFTPTIHFVQNGYRYRYRYKQNIAIAWYIALSTVILSLILILANPGDKAVLRGAGIALPNCVLSIFLWIKALRNGNISVNKEYWKYGVTLSLPLVLHTVCLGVLSQSDRIFIAKICGQSDTGVYSLVYSYGIIITVITNAIADGWLPWFHDNYYAGNFESIRINARRIVILGCYIGLACVALAPEAIRILGGAKYLRGLPCATPVIIGIVCQYIYTHYVNIEMHLKKTKYVSFGTVFAAIMNIALNAIFIPRYGYVAAAYTTLASYIALMFIHFLITRMVLKVRLYDDRFMFGCLIVTALISFVLMNTYSMTVVRYLIIISGFLTFVYYFRSYIVMGAGKIRSRFKQKRKNI